jgi:hypothetical protein
MELNLTISNDNKTATMVRLIVANSPVYSQNDIWKGHPVYGVGAALAFLGRLLDDLNV